MTQANRSVCAVLKSAKWDASPTGAYAQSSDLQGSIATTWNWSLGDRSPNSKQRFERRGFLGVSSVAATSVDDLEYLPDMNWRRNGNSFITSFDFLPGGILRPPLNLILVSGTIIEGAR
jgi:hypothetical protein